MHQIEARDKAWARLDKLRLEGADALQLDVQRMILRGGPGQLTDGTHTLQAEDFYLELQSRRGAARVLGSEGVERLTFDLYTLTPRAMDWKPPDDAFTRERATSLTWLKAREITVFSHEKIVFREAALYTQTKRVLNLPPIWIMALPGYSGESNNQIVGLNSTGGVAFRFPWFVAASDVPPTLQIEKGPPPATSPLATNGPSVWCMSTVPAEPAARSRPVACPMMIGAYAGATSVCLATAHSPAWTWPPPITRACSSMATSIVACPVIASICAPTIRSLLASMTPTAPAWNGSPIRDA